MLIPPIPVESIDVITGGASAVYGSDAIAGAVNFKGDISAWDVSAATDMSKMFLGSDSFNGDILNLNMDYDLTNNFKMKNINFTN